MKSLSRVRLFATPCTVAYYAPPPMGFPRQEYWSGVPFPEHHPVLLLLLLFFVPGDSTGKEPACQCRSCKRWGFNPWVGKIPCGEGHSNPLQCSCQENHIDRGAWRATVHRVTKRWTQLKRLSTSKLTCFCNLCLPPLAPESVGREGKFALYQQQKYISIYLLVNETLVTNSPLSALMEI